jgi:O-antigen/teichoic acid export membrane protein
VRFAIGEKWRPAVVLLQITGAVAAISHIGFNWDDYFRARSNTKPLAVASVLATTALLAAGVPLLLSHGLTGLAIGIGIGAGVNLLVRAWYVTRLFRGLAFLRHAIRAIVPTVPAVLAVLIARTVESGPRQRGDALAELVLYALIVIAATAVVERPLLAELLSYVRRRSR